MQEATPTSQSPLFISQVWITTLSFGLMGAMSGVLTGVVDAMRSSGAYVLMSSTALHLLVGCGIGLICGIIYSLSPNSVGFGAFIKATQRLLSPPPQVSDYQRGRVVSSIWLWALVINLLIPTMAWLGLTLSSKVSTPIFALFISIGVIVITAVGSIPLVHGTSRAGGRLLAAVGSQVRHLTSIVPNSLHPILLLASGVVGLLVLSLAFPPLLAAVKSIQSRIGSIIAVTSLGILVAGLLWGGVGLLTGARFKSLISGALRLLRFGQTLTNPMLHLTLVSIYSLYHFMMWIWSSPPEWRQMHLHHVVLVTLFFIPLLVGGEYLRPFIQYSRKLGVFALLLLALFLGTLGVNKGLEHDRTRESLYKNTTSSALILQQVHTFFDQDGDGFASALGERDCDDQNPDIHPGAFDVPGNEIDEDCDGVDLLSSTLKPTTITAPRKDLLESTIVARDVEVIENKLVVTKPLFDRIDGPHHIIWVTLPGLLTDSIKAQPAPIEEGDKPAKNTVKARREVMTPALSSLAQRGLWLQSAYATTPDTPISIFSILTGRYPSELIRNTKTQISFSRAMHPFPEALQRAHYQNAAFFSDARITREGGFAQGFSVWENLTKAQNRARRRKNGALSELVDRLKIHLGELSLGKREYAFAWLHSDELLSELKAIPEGLSDRRRAKLISKNREVYSEALLTIDRAIAQLNEVLKESEASYGSFTIVVNGLHGYDFEGHSPQTLREEWIKTTAMIVSSEVKPRIIKTPMRLLSLTSTILDFAEIETFDPKRELMDVRVPGIATWALGDAVEVPPIYAESFNQSNNLAGRIWLKNKWKLFGEMRGRRRVVNEQLYWLTRYGEERDVRQIEETRHQIMTSDLERFEINSRRAYPTLLR
jgi:hypothetical protein